VQLTQDQNYRTVIDAQLLRGTISEDEYHQKEKKAHALINYIGIGDIQLIDYNHTPFVVKPNDRLLITSDGLYRYLTDEEIAKEVLRQEDVKETVNNLFGKSLQNARKRSKSRDNLTMILINVK
jgi:protein phosphatase